MVHVDGNKLIVRGEIDSREVELHYRLKEGKAYGFSKEQFKSIFSWSEKPLYRVNIAKGRSTSGE